jgi:hypothetical protein
MVAQRGDEEWVAGPRRRGDRGGRRGRRRSGLRRGSAAQWKAGRERERGGWATHATRGRNERWRDPHIHGSAAEPQRGRTMPGDVALRVFLMVEIKLKPFDGSNFKRWRELDTLWLTAMNVMYVATGKAHEGVSEEKFNADDNLFRGAIIGVLVDNLVDTYLQRKKGKDIWEVLEAQYGASDADGELYVMEQFLDYRMVENRSVVEQAHEVQALAKELGNYSKEAPCVLPNKFVTGAIIAMLSHSWRDFATSLKHKRKEFTFDDLIATLDVEEKAREKYTRGKC